MDLLLGADGDLVIEGGELQFVRGREAIAQHIGTRLRMFRGEWFLDRNLGVPYLDGVLDRIPDVSLVTPILRRVILGTPGVDSVERLEFSLDSETRTLTVLGEVVTTDGPVDLTAEVTF